MLRAMAWLQLTLALQEKEPWLFEYCRPTVGFSFNENTAKLYLETLGGKGFCFLKNSSLMGGYLEVTLNFSLLAPEQRAAEQSSGSLKAEFW